MTQLAESSFAVFQPFLKRKNRENQIMFEDNERRIDMVLAYGDESCQGHKLKRRILFEENLIKTGLQLETEDKQKSSSGDLYFVKIHAPWEVLAKYAELINLKMPLKDDGEDEVFADRSLFNRFRSRDAVSRIERTQTSFLTAPFVRSMEFNFLIESKDSFFIPSQRSMIVWHILSRTAYDTDNIKIGINKLLSNGVYKDAFPLHDGDHEAKKFPPSDRELLYNEWGSPSSWYRQQPLPLIRDYFGDKVGVYFAWLGFYTRALILPAFAGFFCFLYGVFTVGSEENTMSAEICNETGAGNITMCPLCNGACPYWNLGDSCLSSKISYLFDNPATFAFSIFMAVWATVFLELWKRRQTRLAWEWDLLDPGYIEDEEIRPEFEGQASGKRISPITKRPEPYLSVRQKVLRFVTSGVGIFFVACTLVTAMLAVIGYRLVILTVFATVQKDFVRDNAKLFTSVTAGILNLIIITILNRLGRWIARVLTEWEAHRTQTEFENSYTFKLFIFEFINNFSSIIYTAIFKGRFYVHPGDGDAKTSIIKQLRTDACDPAGCLYELCIQLAIIMVGKQVFNNFVEILLPLMKNWWRYRSALQEEKHRHESNKLSRWEADYNLEKVDSLSLYEEYLEMVIQYGFVILFVAAFPLAPLFALLNNVIELRVDAYKIVTQIRRPVAQRVPDMGVWLEILRGITYCAVVSNALVLAFTSDFVPHLVYFYMNGFSMEGYINNTLSVFNTSHYSEGMGPSSTVDQNRPSLCRYRALRNPPGDHKGEYDLSPFYWNVTTARLAFVVVFEHFVFGLTGLIAYAIPDVPVSVQEKRARERLLAREAFLEQEREKSTFSVKRKLTVQKETNNQNSANQDAKTANLQTEPADLEPIPTGIDRTSTSEDGKEHDSSFYDNAP